MRYISIWNSGVLRFGWWQGVLSWLSLLASGWDRHWKGSIRDSVFRKLLPANFLYLSSPGYFSLPPWVICLLFLWRGHGSCKEGDRGINIKLFMKASAWNRLEVQTLTFMMWGWLKVNNIVDFSVSPSLIFLLLLSRILGAVAVSAICS